MIKYIGWGWYHHFFILFTSVSLLPGYLYYPPTHEGWPGWVNSRGWFVKICSVWCCDFFLFQRLFVTFILSTCQMGEWSCCLSIKCRTPYRQFFLSHWRYAVHFQASKCQKNANLLCTMPFSSPECSELVFGCWRSLQFSRSKTFFTCFLLLLSRF